MGKTMQLIRSRMGIQILGFLASKSVLVTTTLFYVSKAALWSLGKKRFSSLVREASVECGGKGSREYRQYHHLLKHLSEALL